MRLSTLLFCSIASFHTFAQNQPASPSLADGKLTCEEIEAQPNVVLDQSFDLGTGFGSPTEIDYYCPKSLINIEFLQKLLNTSRFTIRKSYCSGSVRYARGRSFRLTLLELGYAPHLVHVYRGKSYTQKSDQFFEEWSYQSLFNRRIYEDFIAEQQRVKPLLTEWYVEKHQFDREVAAKYADIAIRKIVDWGHGDFPYNYQKPEPVVKGTMQALNHSPDNMLDALSQSTEQQKFNTLRRLLIHEVDSDIVLKVVNSLKSKTIQRAQESPLSLAINNPDHLALLIAQGFNVNHTNGFGKTPLFYAIQHSNPEAVQTLISAGANVNAKYKEDEKNDECLSIEKWGRTPLMHAAQHANTHIIGLLLSAGANASITDVQNNTALDYARQAKKEENIKYLSAL